MVKKLCPNCGYLIEYEEHIFKDRVELRCPVCGFRVRVIYREEESFRKIRFPLKEWK